MQGKIGRPDRFQALAALPLQDPELAARELGRCVQALKFKGALVNSFSTAANGALIYNIDHAAHWFDSTRISEADRMKLGRTHEVKLFKLGLP